MPRLPIPGQDNGTWGDLLNEFLNVSHASDGTLKPNVIASGQLQSSAVTHTKLSTTNSPSNGQFLSYNGSSLTWAASSGSGVTDHGALTGLSDDDHPQYHTDARGDARYYTKTQVDSALGNKAATAHGHAIADTTNLQTALDSKQPTDSDLTAIAALSPTNDDIIQRKAGAWTTRTTAQLKTDLALAKGDVGLSNVDNTSDASKPVSSAVQTALDVKASTSHAHTLDNLSDVTIASASNGQVLKYNGSAWVNDSDSAGTAATWGSITGSLSSQTDLNTALNGKEPVLAAGATTQYYRGDKSWQTLDKSAVGLPNVDNTSDANKPISGATQTALNNKSDTTHTHAGYAASTHAHTIADTTGLQTALDAKISSTEKGAANGVALLDANSKVVSAGLTATAATAAGIPVIIKGAASQTADLQQWQNSAGAVLAKVTSAGALSVSGKISNVTDPTAAQDAATKNYVDTNASNGSTAYRRAPVGKWVPHMPFTGLDNPTLANNTLYAHIWMAGANSFDRLALSVQNAPTAGATARIGVYSINASGYPDQLVADFGSTTFPPYDQAVITISPTFVRPAGPLAIVMQTSGFGATAPAVRAILNNSALWNDLYAETAADVIGGTSGSPIVGYTASRTGADLPATYPAGATIVKQSGANSSGTLFILRGA